MAGKLNVALLWHMHQPYYRDPSTDKYVLPWVRLHGIKGYTDMLTAVRNFGDVQVTFNFTPCLIRQIVDLTENQETDLYFDLSLIPAADLKLSEKKLILRHFFSANWETMVLRYPRYRDLLNRRGRRASDPDIEKAAVKFTKQDFLDLQVWFNLTWFGWSSEQQYPEIREFKKKGKEFNEGEKKQLLNLQIEVLKKIISDYRLAWEQKKIDISTSPYYHPILPLLIDNYCARISQPQDAMPKSRLQVPDDAWEQLIQGKDFIGGQFGQTPVGLWPSEGSVSPAVCEMAKKAGFTWMATDESVLLATLSGGKREDLLYQPYLTSAEGPAIVFRDRFLSDAIGFRYARNTPKQSVDDFMSHLSNISNAHASDGYRLVTVILDGENAWEYFPDGGEGFLSEFYQRLSTTKIAKTTTIRDYVKKHPAEKVLPPIFPASWIRGNFQIWIGDPVKNRAWDELKRAADAVAEAARKDRTKDAAARARERLWVAEGSDWFWWYGEPNHSDFDSDFDQLFRFNLMQVYRELNLDIPEELSKPIGQMEPTEEFPLFLMQPQIDGLVTNFYEWAGALCIRASDFSGSMNFTTGLLDKIYYGISQTHLFIRMDPTERFSAVKNLTLIIRFLGKGQPHLKIAHLRRRGKPEAIWCGSASPVPVQDIAFSRILEVAVPFDFLPTEGDEIYFAIALKQGDLEIERWPREGGYSCPRPTQDYLTRNWVV
jgi:alpha-amylase/alpha-mannosidase (GH57 family)